MTLSTRRHGGSATRERPGSEVWHLMMITGLSCVRCGTLYCVEGWAAWGSYTFGYVHGACSAHPAANRTPFSCRN